MPEVVKQGAESLFQTLSKYWHIIIFVFMTIFGAYNWTNGKFQANQLAIQSLVNDISRLESSIENSRDRLILEYNIRLSDLSTDIELLNSKVERHQERLDIQQNRIIQTREQLNDFLGKEKED